MSNFYAWRNKLTRDPKRVAAKFVPVVFQNMPAAAQEGIQGVHFDLPGGACMRLPADPSVLRLCQAVAAVVAVTDMRKGFNGRSGLVKEHFDVDLFSGHLFVFFSRRRDYVNVLHWDKDGLAIWAKRLEKGTFRSHTNDPRAPIEMDAAELMLIPQGIDLSTAIRRKRY